MVKYFVTTIAMAGLLVGGWFAGRQYPDLVDIESITGGTPSPQTVQGQEKLVQEKVIAQGKLVPGGGIRNVYAAPGLRIGQVLVKKSEFITEGRTELVTFQGQQSLKLQQQLAEAKKEEAAKQIRQQSIQIETQITTAQAALSTAQLRDSQASSSSVPKHLTKKLEQAKKELLNIQALADDPDTSIFVSKNQIDKLKLAIETSEEELQLAKDQAERLKQTTTLAVKTAQAGLEAARKTKASLGTMEQASKSLDLGIQLARQQLESSRLFAPAGGTIIDVFVKDGDATTTQPILQIGDLTKMECEAEVADRLANKVAVGNLVVMTSSALDNPLTGKVVEVGRTVGRAGVPSLNPLAPAEKQVVKVRIALDPKHLPMARKLVFLQVEVDIRLKEKSSLLENTVSKNLESNPVIETPFSLENRSLAVGRK